MTDDIAEKKGAVMGVLKPIGEFALLLCALGTMAIVGAALFNGATWALMSVMPYAQIVINCFFVLCLLVFLPCSLYWRTRTFAAYGFFVAAFLFLNVNIVYGFLITYLYWGAVGALIGLCFCFLGVIPTGMVAAFAHGDWSTLIQFGIGIAAVVATCAYASWLARLVDRRAARLWVAAK